MKLTDRLRHPLSKCSTLWIRRAAINSFFVALALTSAVGQATGPATLAVPSITKPESSPAATGHKKSPALRSWQILSSGAANRNAMRRAEAIAALGTAGSQRRVVRLVEDALDDNDPSIRELAAKTLGEMRARSAIPKLTRTLDDDSAEVSFAAAKALWTMGNHAGRDVFFRVLAGERTSSNGLIKDELQNTKKKLQDPRGLAVIGAKEAASSLFGPAGWGIKVMEEITQDRAASARATSAILLGPDPTLDTLHQLQDALNDKNWIVRAAAAQALGVSRHLDQVSFLQPLLQDGKPAVRFMAAAAILRLSAGAGTPTSARALPATAEVRPALDPEAQKSSSTK